MKESCHTDQSFTHLAGRDGVLRAHAHSTLMSHIWMSHATHMNKSCHTYAGVMSHTWRSHVTHMNGSRHTHQLVMSHAWRSQVTQKNHSRTWREKMESSGLVLRVHSCHTYEWVTLWHASYIWTSHVTHMNHSHTTHLVGSDGILRVRAWGTLMSHTWMSHAVTHDTRVWFHKRVMSHKWIIHALGGKR